MTDLSGPDRSWLVAGLTLAGLTAKEIAARLSCSLRLVRTIRAEEMTQVCYLAQKRESELLELARAADHAQRFAAHELSSTKAQLARTRFQLDQIIDAHIVGDLETFPRCGHPKVPYNVYRYVDRSGAAPRVRLSCRHCNRDRVAAHREKRRKALSPVM